MVSGKKYIIRYNYVGKQSIS